MNSILEKVKNVDPNNNDALKDVIGTFIQNLNKHTEIDCYHWLTTLQYVIDQFPKFCMNHRNTIENHIKHFLESSNQWLVIEAAKCAHVLQQVRPSQEKVATPKTLWMEQLKLLCKSVHSLVQTIFSNSIDIYEHGNKFQEIKTDDAPSTIFAAALSQIHVVKNSKSEKMTSESKLNVLCKRLNNVFVFIQAMLVEAYPVAKMIQPTIILSVILRTLSMSSVNDDDDDDVSLTKHVSCIKIQALKTLEALVLSLNTRIIEYSPLVFRCIMQTIRWSSEHPNEESSKVCCQAYNSLSLWLTTLQCHIPNSRTDKDKDVGKTMEHELVECIIRDITPTKHVVELTMSNQPTRNLSKKAKRKLAKTMLQQSGIAKHVSAEKDRTKPISDCGSDERAIAALSFAEVFITVSGVFLQQNLYELLLSHLIKECHSIESYSIQRSLHLLKALEACRKSTRPDAPYAAKYCLPLYSKLRNSPHFEISSLCLRGCLDLRVQLHGAPPSLLFEVGRGESEFAAEQNRKGLSESNRRIIENLIVAESVSESDSESIRSTQGPQRKKLCTEEDHVSVSSKETSIIINDENELPESDEEMLPIVTSEKTINATKKTDDCNDVHPQSETINKQNGETNEEKAFQNNANSSFISSLSWSDSLPINSQSSIRVSYGSPEPKSEKIRVLEQIDDQDVIHIDMDKDADDGRRCDEKFDSQDVIHSDTDEDDFICGQPSQSYRDNYAGEIKRKSQGLPDLTTVRQRNESNNPLAPACKPQAIVITDSEESEVTVEKSGNQNSEDREKTTSVDNDKPAIKTNVDNDKPAITTNVDNDKSATTTNVDKDKPAITTNVDNDKPAITTNVDNDKPSIKTNVDNDKPALTIEQMIADFVDEPPEETNNL